MHRSGLISILPVTEIKKEADYNRPLFFMPEILIWNTWIQSPERFSSPLARNNKQR
jgi:hypothetical protein